MADAIVAEGLVKRYGDVTALKGLDLVVETGAVVGLLGPNGAGKTTAVRILTTLLVPDSGRATVAGLDVRRQGREVRRVIGLAGQYAAVDEYLTGRENLEMVGRLYHLGSAVARRRAGELLERFDLAGAGDRIAKGYSGGMRRRLDLAASLVAHPQVLFLDEPTTGLDPRSRLALWDVIGDLAREGTTVLLTTQYLEEADRLADRIVVIDRGDAIAAGTADELKARVGGTLLEVVVHDPARVDDAAALLARHGGGQPGVERHQRKVSVAVPAGGAAGTSVLTAVVVDADAAGVVLDDVALRRPTLDDVFLALTGHAAEESAPDDPAPPVQPGRGARRAPAPAGADR